MVKVLKSKTPKKRIEMDEETIHEMIAKKAYEIYEKRGMGHGKDLDDWLEAESIVMGKKKNKRR
jgi:S-adenosylmethionine synthetase